MDFDPRDYASRDEDRSVCDRHREGRGSSHDGLDRDADPRLPDTPTLAIATTTLAISAAVLAIADAGVTIAAVERTTVVNCGVVLRVDPMNSRTWFRIDVVSRSSYVVRA